MPPRKQALSKEQAQRAVVDAVSQGISIGDALKAVDRTRKTHEQWRSEPGSDYGRRIDEARHRYQRAKEAGADPESANIDFVEFRRRYLGSETYRHHQAWIDVLEGKPYVPLAGETWDEGNAKRNRVIINVPPFHAKSQVITSDYVTYRICKNPNIRVLIVSKTQTLAKKFLYQIRQRLTSPQYAELQAAFAPGGGFKGEGDDKGAWTANMLYVGGHLRSEGHKDATVEALGIGGHIYGTRADLIVLDDCVTLSNANEYEKQMTWINQEVGSRVGPMSKIVVVGTRVAPVDLYSELMNPDNYLSGKSPWTRLAMPAVYKYAEDPKDWVTLWPRSTKPLEEEGYEPDEDGLYPAWDGPALADVRGSVAPRTWALVYQQQPISEDSVFHPTAVTASMDGRRRPGPLRPGEWGGRRDGAEGLHVIGSIDPASSGDAFILIYAVDPRTRERYVLNCFTKSSTPMSWYIEQMESLTPEYGVHEWIIENQAYSSWLIEDERVKKFSASRGIPVRGHYTSRNKTDPDWGVQSMAPLFGTLRKQNDTGKLHHNDDNLIHLPDSRQSEGVKALMEQLIVWQPGKLGRQLRQDGPMSLWFAETRARDVIHGRSDQNTHFRNKYASRRSQRKQAIVSLDEYRIA